MLISDEIKAVLAPQFNNFLGKSVNGVPLWAHSFGTWSVAAKIAKFVPRFNDRERRLIEITALIHDIGKMTEKNQSILSGEIAGKANHTQTREKIKSYFVNNKLHELLVLSEEDYDFIYHAHLHHNLPDNALKTAPPSMGIYANVIRYADWLTSNDRLDRSLVQRIANEVKSFCQITSVQISRPEGPAAYVLLDVVGSIYMQHGWEVLLVLPDGVILIAPIGATDPDKRKIAITFEKRIIEKSLRLQKPNPTNFAAVLLAGESAKQPYLYLQVHEEYILDALRDFERAPSFFLKLLIDMLDLSDKLTPAIKEKYPVLDILKGLCGTRGIPGARRKWQEMGWSKVDPLKEMLAEIFDGITIGQVLPEEIGKIEEASVLLRKVRPERLYSILAEIADKAFLKKEDGDLKNEIYSIISMEEVLDFREIALARFAKYKEYKASQNPERGVCESCGSPAAFPTQKSLGFPSGKRWGFSQISAHTESARATCTLCACETMLMRNKVLETKNPIYVRIESKCPDIWPLYGEIAKLILRLDEGFRNPYTLECLEKTNDYDFLPLPKEFKLPKMKESKLDTQPFSSIRGYIFQINSVNSSASPKDLRAKYMSFYALLKMMGFDVHIGFEEQTGLFGDMPIAKYGEDYESLYYRGLAIKWLANLLGGEKREKQNAHVFAEALLNKSPSVAVTKIGDSVDRIGEEQIGYILDIVAKGNFKIKINNGGDYGMSDLLKDAAFFADKEKGIPHYCIEPESRKDFWKDLSKHKATKPVAQALDSILSGAEFDVSMSKFLRNISVKIDQEDQEGLINFISKTQNILKDFYDLRHQDISKFIQAKNALLSSIFLLTRYQNLKEVVNG